MYLKKISIGNPLINFQMWEELDEYEKITTDEELAAFHHKLLNNCPEERTTLIGFIYAMIAYSTGVNINPQVLI